MIKKNEFGLFWENQVKDLIQKFTTHSVSNLNDIRANHPVTDLVIKDKTGRALCEISVKAKRKPTWPAVRGIYNDQHFIVFVDAASEPSYYVLNNADWQGVLKKIIPYRSGKPEIKNGAIEWNWIDENGKSKKRRGSELAVEEVAKFRNNWAVIQSFLGQN